MDKVTRALTPEEVARVEAQNAKTTVEQATAAAAPEPPKLRSKSGKERERVIPLEFEVEYDGIVYDTITVRRSRGSDFRIFASLNEDKDGELVIAALLTGVPKEVIAALDGDDFMELQAAIRDFVPRKMQ